ncbi:MAG: GGDEF domain-containing protein [Candidatus Micrarchaeota archaeon]|nr:GGDEF domain-containing protein [Candidatus Micrarchaeota archaeon]MDE1824081.1 GGDEF domain-containing protein [Candidatus Micrarchaeota archaeon]
MNPERKIKKDKQIQGLRGLARRSTDTQELMSELMRLRRAYGRLSRDSVTGLYVRSEGEEALKRLVKNARAKGTDISVVFFDLVKFKELNDRFGHDAGDEALGKVGALIGSLIRDTDIAYRFGGDEIVVALPNASKDDAAAFIQRVSGAVETKGDELRESYGIPELRISAGSKTMNGREMADAGQGMRQLLREADRSMYADKNG